MKEKHSRVAKQLEQLQSRVEELQIENERIKKELENGKNEHRRQVMPQNHKKTSKFFVFIV